MALKIFSSFAIFAVAFLSSNGASAFQMASKTQQKATSLNAMSRREVFAASASAAMLAGLPLDALAASSPKIKPDKETAAKFYFNGVFRDKNHPEGYRVVAGAVGKSGTVTIQDGPGEKVVEIPMKAIKDEVTGLLTLTMDLSSYRADYKDKEVVADVKKDGSIYFPDGNVWKKEGGVVGVYIDGFAPYPKYRRVVLPGKSGNVEVTMVSGKKIFDVPGVDLGKKGLQVDFPGKQCTGKVNSKQGSISWADGNVWTKI